jgi:hypothetical protein
MKKLPSILILTSLILAANRESIAQVKISAMPETKEDPAGGWIPVVLSNKNYKYNPGSYVQQRTIENIRGLSPTNLPADYVYYVTDLGKEGFFRYDASDVDKPNDNPATKASVDDGATVLVTKNNLRFKRIIENNTVNAKWFEMGNDPSALINTLKYRNNAVITYEQAKAIFDKPNSRVTLQDTDFKTQTATWFALQRAINFCLASANKLYIPAGEYNISKGLLVAAPPGVYTTSFEIAGAVTPYDPDKTNQTMLKFSNKDNFGIGFHRVKGVRVRNLFVKGENRIGLDAGKNKLYDWFENPNMDWVHGCRDVLMSPHAGFVVDPLYNGANGIPNADMYPGFEVFYTDPDGSGGSTDVIFENCRVQQFVVGYCFSPHSYPQNGDNIAVNNCWVDYCKSGISLGQSQNRSVAVNNLKCWGGVEVLFDSQRYSDGTSDNVEVDQLQIAGGVKFLTLMSGWANKGLQIKRMHAELLLSLGSGNLRIEDSFIDLVGVRPEYPVHPARTAFTGSLVIKDSFFGQYQGVTALPISIAASKAKFENVSFYNPVHYILPNNSLIDNAVTQFDDFKGVVDVGLYAPEKGVNETLFLEGSEWLMNRYYMSTPYKRVGVVDKYPQQNFIYVNLSQSVTLTTIDPSAFEATLTLPPTLDDFKILKTGDHLYTKDNVPDEFGKTGTFLLGRVKSTNPANGEVILELTAKGINSNTTYPITLRRDKFLIYPLIIGDITAGSNIVNNCSAEARAPLHFIGYTIQSPYFPPGTFIVSSTGTGDGSGSITLSNNANASIKGIEVIGADWNAIEYGTYPDTWPHVCCYQAYKKGDVIYNTDLTNYPDVEKWVCTKSGLTGSIFVPEFNTTTMDVSSKFTGATTIINGQIAVSKGRFISNIVVSTDKAISSIRIGTTPGGSDVLAGGSTTSVAANTSKIIAINKYYNRRPSGPSGPDGTTTMTLYVQFSQGSATTATINMLISK